MLSTSSPAPRRMAGRSTRPQGGTALVEVLVALLALALGIGGLAWSQARLLADGRQALGRATAITLVADLTNRMMANRAAVLSGDYFLSWGEHPAGPGCSAGCTAATVAQADLASWRAALAAALPQGDAAVFQVAADARLIGIAIAWAVPESAFAQPPMPSIVGVTCPAAATCHVAYVQP